MGDGCCESMVHGVSLETSQHRGASTVKQRLLSSSMFCPHQHTGPIAACRMHLSVVLRFSVLTKDCKGKALIVLLVFSYLLFPFSRVSLSIIFSRIFATIFLRCAIVFWFGKCRFYFL